MFEYKIICTCEKCGKKETWYLNTDKRGENEVVAEVLFNMSSIIEAGYKCEQCGKASFRVDEIAGEREL